MWSRNPALVVLIVLAAVAVLAGAWMFSASKSANVVNDAEQTCIDHYTAGSPRTMAPADWNEELAKAQSTCALLEDEELLEQFGAD